MAFCEVILTKFVAGSIVRLSRHRNMRIFAEKEHHCKTKEVCGR